MVWNLPPDWHWQQPGTVRVHGTATDVLGRKLPALAVVTVDTIASTLPARAKTYVGGRPELPATVTGVGKRGGKAELPVAWDAAAFDHVGTVTVTGRAQVVDGSTVAATAVVQVTEPVEVNAALRLGRRGDVHRVRLLRGPAAQRRHGGEGVVELEIRHQEPGRHDHLHPVRNP